jgi:hypothetical protein
LVHGLTTQMQLTLYLAGYTMIVVSKNFYTDFLSSLAYLLLGLCDFITFAVVVWIIAHELKHL